MGYSELAILESDNWLQFYYMLRSRTVSEGGLVAEVLRMADAIEPELLELFAMMDAAVNDAQEELRKERK